MRPEPHGAGKRTAVDFPDPNVTWAKRELCTTQAHTCELDSLCAHYHCSTLPVDVLKKR